ncbi:P-loop containing nucleoside triphosphate hydrolase protein [Neolentinus lepideus HHB14362 ss-1]|uniref:p-loop containing nucleoside triphosphate hydrolase protein n=1 Tax=Neolentinus lepideus HHB14362 ss-1 TaxID=1314782 RepID=A0A165QS82_9AGAM|nr:P-loop containing nucleoside triphosphate hydrolase protein [Neolentinus lepideus HHB14362 ss-1]
MSDPKPTEKTEENVPATEVVQGESQGTAELQATALVDSVSEQKQDTESETLSSSADAGPHFLKLEQIWDYDEGKWVPYDSSKFKPPPPRFDLHNYFYINVRYKNALDTPKKVLTNFSPMLIPFLRRYVGDTFFYSDPEYDLVHFFPSLKWLHKKHAALRNLATSIDESGPDERRKMARKLGAKDAEFGHLDDKYITRYLTDIGDHAEILLQYLDEEFKPTAERLAALLSYGQIEYDLLRYHFEPDVTVFTTTDDPMAYIITETEYITSDPKAYHMTGKAVRWSGHKYEWHFVSIKITQFAGTKELDALPCAVLTDEVKENLKKRGRVYTSYAGMHYRSYVNSDIHDRVIVDRIAYDNQDGYVADPSFKVPKLHEDQLHLLPSKVYGFNMTRKLWMSFHVNHLHPVQFDESAWDHLVLDPDTKTLIKGLVDVTKNANSTKDIISDVISGKGGGLIAVLHGPPGTGKTLTAEAVAEYLKRPLYMVGSSELPTSPSRLESSLRSILKLATAWDAVLLIDEADVYLEQRSLHELERNALVSVALRVLEYHRGVLFLTTNRIKDFDDAFLSKFSIGIKYPELDQSARKAVWQKFFQLAGIRYEGTVSDQVATTAENECVITSEDLEELSAKPFNGRTIKNLVRTSQALALASNVPLSIEHVRVVVRASEKFLDEFATAER